MASIESVHTHTVNINFPDQQVPFGGTNIQIKGKSTASGRQRTWAACCAAILSHVSSV
eukprot:COSAG06_NODE_26_length_32102_cov_250.952911_9_plen_58_part_00